MKRFLFTAAILAAGIVCAAPGHRVVGSGIGGNSPYATDAYPGFDGLDDLPKPERREKSWFLHVARDTPIEQFAYAKELAENNDFKKACKMCDALVREWPASPEAPQAQLMYAMLLAKGPSYESIIKSPIYTAMEEGAIARVEEISRCASEVQDALISILSEKRIAIPELSDEVAAKKGFSPSR